MYIGKKIIQIENGINYQLTWTVKGDVTTSIGLVKFNPFFSQGLLIHQ